MKLEMDLTKSFIGLEYNVLFRIEVNKLVYWNR